MALIFLILILTGGHLSFKHTHKGQMELIRMQGYHHYFEVFFLGLVIFSLTFTVIAIMAFCLFNCNLLNEFSAALGTKQPTLSTPIIITFTLYLIVARYIWPWLQYHYTFNDFISTKKEIVPHQEDSMNEKLHEIHINHKLSIQFDFIQKTGSNLEKLLAWSMEENKPILITATNNKAYVGYIAALSDPSTQVECKDFAIFPMKSGYRAKEDGEYKIYLNKDYIQYVREKYFDKVLENTKEEIKKEIKNKQLAQKDIKKIFTEEKIKNIFDANIKNNSIFNYFKKENIFIVLPITEVCSANPYDEAIYKYIEPSGENKDTLPQV